MVWLPIKSRAGTAQLLFATLVWAHSSPPPPNCSDLPFRILWHMLQEKPNTWPLLKLPPAKGIFPKCLSGLLWAPYKHGFNAAQKVDLMWEGEPCSSSCVLLILPPWGALQFSAVSANKSLPVTNSFLWLRMAECTLLFHQPHSDSMAVRVLPDASGYEGGLGLAASTGQRCASHYYSFLYVSSNTIPHGCDL